MSEAECDSVIDRSGGVVALYLKRRQRRFAVHNWEISYKKTVQNEEIEYGPQILGAEAY